MGTSRDCPGHSILELLGVLGILGIIGVLAYPALAALSERSRAGGAGHQIEAAMAHARQLAITSRTPTGMLFLRRPDRWLLWIDEDLDREPDISELVVPPTPLLEGACFGRPSGLDPITFVQDKVIFTTMGGTSGLPGTVYVMSGRSVFRVTVLTNGRIRLYSKSPA